MKIILNKWNIVWGLFLGSAITFSCSNLHETESIVNPQIVNSDESLHMFGKVLSKAVLRNADVREFLKEEASKQFDGDYDVFYQMVKEHKILNGKTFHEILRSYSDQPDEFDKLTDSNLELNIKIPMLNGISADTWNTDEEIPHVAIRDHGIITEKSLQFDVYDGLGQLYKIPARVAPDKITLVVENSERIEVKSKSTINADIISSLKTYAAPSDRTVKSVQRESPKTTRIEQVARMGSCERDAYSNVRQRLTTVTIKTVAWQRVVTDSDWAEGVLEIQAQFIYAANVDARDFSTQLAVGTVRIGYDRMYFNPCQNYFYSVAKPNEPMAINYDLVIWDKNKSGDTWKVVFVEKDGGNFTVEKTVSFSTSFEFSFPDPITGKSTTTLSYEKKLTYTDADDQLGEVFLSYCDGQRSSYDNQTDISFKMGVSTDPAEKGATYNNCRSGGPR